MKIVFHENFNRSDYASASDGAASPGRMEAIMTALKPDGYHVVSPEPATYKDLLLAHTESHIANIQKDTKLFEMACLSAGGAALAAKMAFRTRRSPVFVRRAITRQGIPHGTIVHFVIWVLLC